MKKLLLVLAIAAASTMTAQSRWGVRTGLNYNLNTIGLSDAATSAQEIFEGQTSDNGYHLGVFGRQYLGDQLYTSEVYSTRKTPTFLKAQMVRNIFYERFDHEFLQLDAGLGLRLLKFARAEGGVHYQGTISDNAFSQTFSSPTAGYNVGLGVDV